MEKGSKKRLILLLLLISCIVSGYFLWELPDGNTQTLSSPSLADTLIQQQLYLFGIPKQQIEQRQITVDSSFTRKIYDVALPSAFSKSQLHAALNRTFSPFGVSTPAHVSFPDRNLHINLLYNNVIFRSINLATDTDLQLNKDQVSIIILFEDPPNKSIIDELISFGEPIPIALSVRHPMQAKDLLKRYSAQYDRLLFWIQNDDNNDLFRSNEATVKRRLNQFNKLLPNAQFLLTKSADGSSVSSRQLAAQTGLTYVDARRSLRIPKEFDKPSFMDALERMGPTHSHTLAIIDGSTATLHWLKQKLPKLKRAGLELIPPSKINF